MKHRREPQADSKEILTLNLTITRKIIVTCSLDFFPSGSKLLARIEPKIRKGSSRSEVFPV